MPSRITHYRYFSVEDVPFKKSLNTIIDPPYLNQLEEGLSFVGNNEIGVEERAELCRSAGWSHYEATAMREMQTILSEQGVQITYLGVRENNTGTLVGCGGLKYDPQSNTGELGDFVVRPEHQHKGIGKALIDEGLRMTKDLGIELRLPPLLETNTLEPYLVERGFVKNSDASYSLYPAPSLPDHT